MDMILSQRLETPSIPEDLRDAAHKFAEASMSQNTRDTYKFAWNAWIAWCDRTGCCPMPAVPEEVGLFLTDCAQQGLKVGTMNVRLMAIATAHRMSQVHFDMRDPKLSAIWKGILNTLGRAVEKKKAILPDDLVKMVRAQPNTVIGVRNRAILLLGFGAALRRGEIVALNMEDVSISEKGVIIDIRKSKTDQTGVGCQLAVPRSANIETDVASALRIWIDLAGSDSGPLFRRTVRTQGTSDGRLSPKMIEFILKGACTLAGMNPVDYGPHSLRAGLATSAALAGKDVHTIMRQTRHKCVGVAMGYIRIADMWRDNVAEGLV